MNEIGDAGGLEAWLKDKPPEFACVVAVRAALRVVPVFRHALHEEAEERLGAVIVPSLRALAAANFAGTWPARAAEIRTAARVAGRDAQDGVGEIGNAVRMSVFEAKDAIPEMDEHVWGLEGDARAYGIAERAVDAAMHALQAAVDCVDAAKGIASRDAVFESCVAAAAAACDAVDGVHGDTELFSGLKGEGQDETVVAAHVAEFWQAVRSDAGFLESGAGARGDLEEVAARLSGSALWREGMPVWAGRQWADFKDDLPETDGWNDWVDWYEGRLTGRSLDAAREFQRVTGSKAERGQAFGEDGETIGERIADRRASAVAGAARPHEVEAKERRYYTDDDVRAFFTASQLKRLSRREEIVHMVSWFRRMYEDPVQETPYDGETKDYLYIRGGRSTRVTNSGRNSAISSRMKSSRLRCRRSKATGRSIGRQPVTTPSTPGGGMTMRRTTTS